MSKEIQLIVKMPIGTTGTFFEYEPQAEKGLYNLTDLWQRFGSIENKEPRQWRRKSGKKFIEALAVKLDVPVGHVIKSTKPKGTENGATWGHYQVYMSYMTYLSPEAQMVVNEIVRQRIEEEANPSLAIDRGIAGYKKLGYSDAWIADRVQGKPIRNEFTAELKAHGVTDRGYGDCTNAIYREVLGGNATELRRRLNLTGNQKTRDHFNRLQLQATSFAEICAITKLEYMDVQNNDTAKEACRQAGKVTDEAIRKLTGASCHVQPKALSGF